MSAPETLIGPSPVQCCGGTPYPAAASQLRWFIGRGMTPEEACTRAPGCPTETHREPRCACGLKENSPTTP